MANYFSDRVVQYPGRVTMTPTGASDTYDMARAEGTVTNPGSPFNSETFNGAIDLYALWYGTCSTAAGTAVKVVSCSGFKLVTGATIAVKFTNAQTSTSAITLNVNSTGAKTVYGIPRSTTSTTRTDGAWEENETKLFMYDGTYWRIIDQNIITSSQLSTLESTLGLSGTTPLRLFEILNALADKTVIETGTSNGWTYEKYSDGTMRATQQLSIGPTWNSIASGFYAAQKDLTAPSGMTFRAGFASPTIKSVYLTSVQVQGSGSTVTVTAHRLSGASNSFNYVVYIEGTYSQ